MTSNSRCVSTGDRVFAALIHTEQERVGAGLIDIFGFPFCCFEAPEDEILGGLNYSQRPSLVIALTMEILCIPPVSCSIIYPLESSFRILVSNEFHDHLLMGGCPKGLRIAKIC